jgi:hypothetical protein
MYRREVLVGRPRREFLPDTNKKVFLHEWANKPYCGLPFVILVTHNIGNPIHGISPAKSHKALLIADIR